MVNSKIFSTSLFSLLKIAKVIFFISFRKKNEVKILYSETCLNRTQSKMKSCINQTLNKVPMQEIFVNLTNRTTVYSEDKSCSQESLVQAGLTVLYFYSFFLNIQPYLDNEKMNWIYFFYYSQTSVQRSIELTIYIKSVTCHDIAEILLKLAFNTNKIIKLAKYFIQQTDYIILQDVCYIFSLMIYASI